MKANFNPEQGAFFSQTREAPPAASSIIRPIPAFQKYMGVPKKRLHFLFQQSPSLRRQSVPRVCNCSVPTVAAKAVTAARYHGQGHYHKAKGNTRTGQKRPAGSLMQSPIMLPPSTAGTSGKGSFSLGLLLSKLLINNRLDETKNRTLFCQLNIPSQIFAPTESAGYEQTKRDSAPNNRTARIRSGRAARKPAASRTAGKTTTVLCQKTYRLPAAGTSTKAANSRFSR